MTEKSIAALSYAKSGLAVFPCHYITSEGKCSCGKESCSHPGKHPMWHRDDLQRGHKDASRDYEQVDRWWTRWTEANIGIPTGAINRLVCIDADARDGKVGIESLGALLNGTKPTDTLLAKSGSDGRHVYFLLEEGDYIPSRIGFRKDLDVKGESGYLIAPPSNHVSGGKYEWIKLQPPIPLPDYLRKLLVSTDFDRLPISQEDWNKVVYKGSPSRDNYLTRLAGSLFRSQVPARDVFDMLLRQNQSNCVPPMTAAEVKRIVKSIAKRDAEQRKRRAAEEERAAQEVKPMAERVFGLGSFSSYMEDFGDTSMPWLIKDWLSASSLSFVLGPPESYKTWLLMALAASLTTGQPFLGHYKPERAGPVIWVQLEDSHPMLASRWGHVFNPGKVERLGPKRWRVPTLEKEPPLYIHRERRLSLADRQSIMDLDLAIREIHPVAVIIDPLYPMLKLKDYGGESAQEMMIFKQMRDHYETTFIIGHHMKKGDGSGRARDRGWGSQFLNAWIEGGIEMLPSDTIPGKVLVERHTKGNLRPPLLDLQWNITPDEFNVEIIETKAKEASAEEKIKEAIQTQALGSYSEITAATGVKSQSAIATTMKKLGVVKLGDRYILGEDIEMPRLKQKATPFAALDEG